MQGLKHCTSYRNSKTFKIAAFQLRAFFLKIHGVTVFLVGQPGTKLGMLPRDPYSLHVPAFTILSF